MFIVVFAGGNVENFGNAYKRALKASETFCHLLHLLSLFL